MFHWKDTKYKKSNIRLKQKIHFGRNRICKIFHSFFWRYCRALIKLCGEAATRGVLKKVFLKILQNSSLAKLQDSGVSVIYKNLQFIFSRLNSVQRLEIRKMLFQKQPPRGVLKKRRSENMQQIYRRTPMPKCNFKKVAKQLYWNQTSTCVFSCKFSASFRTPFTQNPSGWLLLFFR